MSDVLFEMNRRTVLGSALAAGAAFALPGCGGRGDAVGSEAARWTRYSVNSEEGLAQLETYASAIETMLDLPVTDQRNWYRQAMIHLIDCPHGNWWFFNWHRPFVGYFEQICREVSGDDAFAMPYWDWTADPELPSAFWGGGASNPLDPTSDLFFGSADQLMAALEEAIDEFWTSCSDAQLAKLAQRHPVSSLDKLKESMAAAYFGGSDARGEDAQQGRLDADALRSVQLPILQTGLSASLFNKTETPPMPGQTVFNSPITQDHSVIEGFAVIEGQPHNNVHNSIGGLMEEFMSPTDPIFWLHHANIDRIWTVWAALQEERGASPDPSQDVAGQYNEESFLFFVHADGSPVTDRTTAGDYMSPASFDYDYVGGSQVMTEADAMTAPEGEGYLLEANVAEAELRPGNPAIAEVVMRAEAFVTESGETFTPSDGVANIVFTPVDNGKHRYRLYLTGEGETPDLSLDGADYVGTFAFFGTPHSVTPTPVTLSLASWIAANGERLAGPLRVYFHAVPEEETALAVDGTAGSLNSVTLQLF